MKKARALLEFIEADSPVMTARLGQFCAINSSSINPEGLAAMLEALRSVFIPLADEIQTITFPEVPIINMQGETAMFQPGDGLFIRKRPELANRVLLSGHMDTVYDKDSPFQQLVMLDDNRIKGPGVTDMKGGLIVMLHALSAFETIDNADKLGWDVFLSADEELGSSASRQFIDQIAKNYSTALVYEPAMSTEGTFARNRKGSGKLTLVAHGRAAHAGRDFDNGRNAIVYLAKVIAAIDALNGKRAGFSINTGKIQGGSALNVIPDTCVAKFDIRISESDDEHWFNEALQDIVREHMDTDYVLDVHSSFGRPVKKVNTITVELFQRLQKLSASLNMEFDWQDSGGCCDGNNYARHGLAVLDTLGVLGGNIHSPEEYILLDSLVSRAALSALLLADLAQHGLPSIDR